jgi:type I restriction enzyme M protein
MNQPSLSSLIWSVADLLRGDFKQSEYGRVILPFTVLRRLDCVLEPTKAAALAEYAAKRQAGIAFEPFVKRKTGLDFYNVSSLDMGRLMGDQDNIRANLDSYIQGFAPDVRSIFEHFDFAATVDRLHKARLLYLVTEKFARIELHPHAPDAWIDHEKTKIGHEIPFNRHFYVFEPPRELAEIDADLKQVTDRIKLMIEGLSA